MTGRGSAQDAAIETYLTSLRIEDWAPLTSAERDLLRRTVGSVQADPAPPVDPTESENDVA